MAQPISAPQEVVPRDGLRGALGYGVFDFGTAANRGTAPAPDAPGSVAGHPAPTGGLPTGPAPQGAGDPLDPGGRWGGPLGYTLEGLTCGVPGYTASGEFCADPREFPEGSALVASLADQRSFVVGAAVKCSTMGAPLGLAAWQEAADRALELTEWAQVARELWTGERAIAEGWDSNRRLASPAATVLADGDPVALLEAIAALEDAFPACSAGEVQLIHVPRKLVAYLDHLGIVETTPGSGRIWTANNTLIVADRGYPGTGPHGEPPTGQSAWVYSTGPIAARFSQVGYPEARGLADAIAYQTNDVNVRAERKAAAAWLCCHLAVNVCYSPTS